jgi:hypothetical protein
MSIEVPLTQGKVALIDECDWETVAPYKWQHSSGYAAFVRNRKSGVISLRMHRLIMGAKPGQVVDHRNGDGLDNRRENLRICTTRRNSENRAQYVATKRSIGGYLGVYKHKNSGLWVARIHAGEINSEGERRGISLRTFATAEEAARMYDAAAVHYFGEFAALNFPGEPLVPFDPSRHGRRAVGSDVRNAKLSDDAVRAIRASEDGLTALGRRYNVSPQTIWKIRRRAAWGHVT